MGISDRTAPIFAARADLAARFNCDRSLVDSTHAIDANNARMPREELMAFEMCSSARHRGIECSESAVRRDPLVDKKSQKLPGRGGDFCVVQGKRSRRSIASNRSLILKKQ